LDWRLVIEKGAWRKSNRNARIALATEPIAAIAKIIISLDISKGLMTYAGLIHPKDEVGNALSPPVATRADQQGCQSPNMMPTTNPVLLTLTRASVISCISHVCNYAPIA
jgi:hypothetical protein